MTPEEIEAAPKMKLGGHEYPVPMLVPRQNRIIGPKLFKLIGAISIGSGVINIGSMTTEIYDDLIDVVFVAATRANPGLKKDDLLDSPISLPELFEALGIVAEQSGLMRKAAAGAPAPGEARAGTSQTGTASSQE